MINDVCVAVVRDNGRRIVAVAEFLQRRAARRRPQRDAARDTVLQAGWKCGADGKLEIGWHVDASESPASSSRLEAAG